jgi:colanic acid/amylovoran biosynthesis glycosyltransferase
MRIVYVTSSLPYGPREAFIIPEIQEVIRRGHEVLVVPLHPRGPVVHTDARPLLEYVCTQPVLSPHVMKWATEEFTRAPTRAFRALSWLSGSRSASVLVKNLTVYPKGLWLARLAREWGAEHIHAHWAATTATMTLIASKISGIPWSLTAHAWDITDWSPPTNQRNLAENKLLSVKVDSACFVRFISQIGVERAKAQKIRAPLDAKALILYMGIPLVDLQEIGHADRQGEVPKPPVVLCPAGLWPRKGHTYLFEAVAMLRGCGVDLELWLVGEGELQEELQRRARALGLSNRVNFLGQLSHPDLLELYRQDKVDVVVLPSVDLGGGQHEGIPVSLMEAMSYRVPVVSTTTGGISELLGEGAGSLVPPADPAALARAIGRLIEEPELRVQQGDAGRRRVEENFALEKVVDELIARFEACAR